MTAARFPGRVPCLCSERTRPGGRREGGQATVEFAVVAPLLVFLLVGLVAAGWLLFEYEAVADAARAGVREALVQTALLTASGCASGQPEPIERAVQAGATIVPVDASALCQSASDPAELVQAPGAAGDAVVTVTGSPSLSPADMSAVTVTVSLPVHPFPPLPALGFTLSAGSTLPTA